MVSSLFFVHTRAPFVFVLWRLRRKTADRAVSRVYVAIYVAMGLIRIASLLVGCAPVTVLSDLAANIEGFLFFFLFLPVKALFGGNRALS